MKYAFVRDGVIQFEQNNIPSTGRILETQEIIMGLHGAPDYIIRACGWYPVVDNPEPPEGHHVSSRAMQIMEDHVEAVYSYEPIPPRKFTISKYKLLTNFDSVGMFDLFTDWLDALPKKERMLWDAAGSLDSDHPLVLSAAATLPEALGVSEQLIKDIISRSESDA